MVTAAGWNDVRRRLAAELASLTEGEFLVVREAAPEPGPRRGLLRRRPTPAPIRYVQFRHDGGSMYAECVGATHFGGDWDVDADTHERLRGLGWYVPGDDNPWQVSPSYPNYFRHHSPTESAELAELGAASLELLGVDPRALEWVRDQ